MTLAVVAPSVPRDDPFRRAIAWLSEDHHTTIGVRYIVTAFGFFFAGGIEALIMRLQLARPLQHVVSNDTYNQIFTVHGTTMMFLFAVPVMQGVGIYVVPLMIGARDTAFPRLLAFSYWIYLFGGILLYVGLLSNTGPDAGWFSYVPLSGPQFSAGKRVDIWAQMITFTEIGTLSAAVNLVVTILKHRAPGMTLDRMPVFVWSQLVVNFMIIFSLPAIVVCSSMLALDRLVATQFFNASAGGDALLWQHLFWFFGHPEVYIIFLPAMGMTSTLIETHVQRRLVGYVPVVVSIAATGLLAFGLWVHHMFATGLPQLGESFFTAASMMIAIPTGTQLFCWIATMWSGRARFTTSFLFVLSFFIVFVIGGLTGIMLAAVPINLQVHDTYFVVAHLHYVLIGGALFPLFGALYHWFPKMTGRLLGERLGRWNVALMFVGFNLTFFPQHRLGLAGMPRRIYTYAPETGFGTLNLISSIGAAVLGVGVLLFLINVARSYRDGRFADRNPWQASTLEWHAASPPGHLNFDVMPIAHDRYPLWSMPVDGLGSVIGLLPTEQLVTSVVEAKPDHRVTVSQSTLAPFLTAVATGGLIIAVIFNQWGLPIGAVPVAAALVYWFWPRSERTDSIEGEAQ